MAQTGQAFPGDLYQGSHLLKVSKNYTGPLGGQE